MKTKTNKLVLSVIFVLATLSFGSLFADVLVISPESATLPLKGNIKFEVQLFNSSAMPGIMDRQIEWKVVPEDLGKITDDGFFMAGDKPGRGLVIAVLKMMDKEYTAEAKVQVGLLASVDALMPELVITPKKAAIGLGDTIDFNAVVRFPNTTQNLPDILVNWTVKPRTLGKITQRGQFFAGNLPGAGQIIAFIEYMGHRIYGEAYIVVGLRPGSAISGLVSDQDNQTPLADAEILAQRIGMRRWFRRTQSDENGNYFLEKLIPGSYVIRAMKNGFITEFYQDVRYFDQAIPVELTENDTAENINFNLNMGGAISGTIYTEGDSSLLTDAHIFAYLKLNPDKKYHTLSDNNGSYNISGLHTGSYIVSANKSGFQGEFFDDVFQEGDAEQVSVTDPNTTSDIDFALGQRSAISGTVISDAGNLPVKGAVIFARNLNHHDWLMAPRTRTDDQGEYILQLPPGFYLVRVEADSFNGEFYDNTYDPNLADPVEVVENLHTAGTNFSLAPLSIMSGNVSDQVSGSGLAGAVVWAFPEVGGRGPVKTRTDEDGNYQLTRLFPGIYFIKAWANGYYHEFYLESPNLAGATPVAVGYNEQVPDLDFTLVSAGSISGTVLSEAVGTPPVPRALVVARKRNSHVDRRTYTNENGEYTLKDLPAGSYIVIAMAEGFYREFYLNAETLQDATPVDVGESQTVTGIDFSLTPSPENQGAITGYVYADDDQLPIPGAMIVALPFQGGSPHFGVTNPEGRYALKGLDSGKYYVLAWAERFIGEFYDDVHHWKNATAVQVVSPNVTPDISFGLAKKQVGPYMISGRIISHNNQAPVVNAMVYAFRNRMIVGFGVTDEQGNYAIPEMPAGRFTVIASAPGKVQDNDQNGSTADSLSVNLGSGQGDSGADISMGTDMSTDVSESGSFIPEDYGLDQNYPNPFNPETEIRFRLSESGRVSLRVFNMLGQEIAELLKGDRPAGDYSVTWNGLNKMNLTVPSGIYFYRIQVRNSKGIVFDNIRKMTLMR